MKTNLTMNRAQYDTMYWSVERSVGWTLDLSAFDVVYQTSERAINRAMFRAVYGVVPMCGGLPVHPALRDFLSDGRIDRKTS